MENGENDALSETLLGLLESLDPAVMFDNSRLSFFIVQDADVTASFMILSCVTPTSSQDSGVNVDFRKGLDERMITCILQRPAFNFNLIRYPEISATCFDPTGSHRISAVCTAEGRPDRDRNTSFLRLSSSSFRSSVFQTCPMIW